MDARSADVISHTGDLGSINNLLQKSVVLNRTSTPPMIYWTAHKWPQGESEDIRPG
jgi:hypothetical protein